MAEDPNVLAHVDTLMVDSLRRTADWLEGPPANAFGTSGERAARLREIADGIEAVIRVAPRTPTHYVPAFTRMQESRGRREFLSVCGTWIASGDDPLHSVRPTCTECKAWLEK